jgi:hypothetical protein
MGPWASAVGAWGVWACARVHACVRVRAAHLQPPPFRFASCAGSFLQRGASAGVVSGVSAGAGVGLSVGVGGVGGVSGVGSGTLRTRSLPLGSPVAASPVAGPSLPTVATVALVRSPQQRGVSPRWEGCANLAAVPRFTVSPRAAATPWVGGAGPADVFALARAGDAPDAASLSPAVLPQAAVLHGGGGGGGPGGGGSRAGAGVGVGEGVGAGVGAGVGVGAGMVVGVSSSGASPRVGVLLRPVRGAGAAAAAAGGLGGAGGGAPPLLQPQALGLVVSAASSWASSPAPAGPSLRAGARSVGPHTVATTSGGVPAGDAALGHARRRGPGPGLQRVDTQPAAAAPAAVGSKVCAGRSVPPAVAAPACGDHPPVRWASSAALKSPAGAAGLASVTSRV